MPRPKRSTEGASIHVVIDSRLKQRMEKVWVKAHGALPQGAWQRFVEAAIREHLGA